MKCTPPIHHLSGSKWFHFSKSRISTQEARVFSRRFSDAVTPHLWDQLRAPAQRKTRSCSNLTTCSAAVFTTLPFETCHFQYARGQAIGQPTLLERWSVAAAPAPRECWAKVGPQASQLRKTACIFLPWKSLEAMLQARIRIINWRLIHCVFPDQAMSLTFYQLDSL